MTIVRRKMKTLSDYHCLLYLLLGDAGGRRYTTDTLNMALRQALETVRKYCPNKKTVKAAIAKSNGPQSVLNWFPAPDEEILNVRTDTGKPLTAAIYRTGGKTILIFYGPGPRPAAGDKLQVELSLCHTIRDLDGAAQTTVPDSLANTVCTGAAANALRMRARSVTEVFGKRPEDVERLMQQADLMDRFFINQLKELLWKEKTKHDPWPRHGFPI